MAGNGFFGRLANLWRGFLSIWISDVEKKHPEIAYENAINTMIEKYTTLKKATAAIIRRREEIDARLGDKNRAAALVREGGDLPDPIWGRALYHLFCDEIDEAASWFERMIQQREPFAIIFARDSVLKPLRASRHWPRLTQLMNLPEPAT